MRVILYHRVSSDEQAARGTIATQRHQTKSIVERYSLDVVDVVEDEGLSGTTLEGRRLADVLRDIEAGRGNIGGIVCVAVDRLMRVDRASAQSRKDGFYIENVLLEKGTKIYTLEGAQDLESISYLIQTGLASAERTKFRQRTDAGRYRKIIEEKAHIWRLPFGYSKKEGKIILDPSDSIALVNILTWICLEGCHFASDQANKAGFKTIFRKRNAEKLWHPATVRKLANNLERYKTGKFTYLWKGHEVAYDFPPVPIPDYVYKGLPIALKTRSLTWDRKNRAVLSGFIACIHHTSQHDEHKIRLKSGPHHVWCQACHKTMRQDELEALVWDGVRYQAARLLESETRRLDTTSLEYEISELEKALEAVTGEAMRLSRAFVSGIMPESDYHTISAEIVQKRRDFELRLLKAKQMLYSIRHASSSAEVQRRSMYSAIDEVWNLKSNAENCQKIREFCKNLLGGNRILVDLEGRRIVIPPVGSVRELEFDEGVQLRSNRLLQLKSMHHGMIQLRDELQDATQEKHLVEKELKDLGISPPTSPETQQ